MVLIITEENDFSSRLVCDWIRYLGGEILTINNTENIRILNYISESKETNFSFLHKNTVYSTNEFTSIWFRRGWFKIEYTNMKALESSPINIDISYIEQHVKDEIGTFQHHLYQSLSLRKNVFGNVNNYNVNKLDTLELAQKIGLKTPSYCITTLKSQLLRFKNMHNEQIMSKAIKENINYVSQKSSVFHVNNIINDNDFLVLPDVFQATLFQVYYEKYFEIRVFYFNEKIFSMAIFSQQNEKTKTDYRNYDDQKQTRCLPYSIPNDLLNKIILLMKSMKLKTGSIDFIYSKSNEYIFLEINPVGQFGIVSRATNTFIEKIIAQNLLSY